ncbi:MAG: glutathione S-transferase family protein [Candidatus Dadabacteria bacterium]|nr:MAG: glutathione S-transferase family protein [Candidatus Dadabacteria bacterium]
MLKLYDHPLSGNCYKVRLALSQLGVEYEKEYLDIFKGEQHSSGYQSVNPNRKIPVLVDGGFHMWESNAILLYIGKKYSPNRLYLEDLEGYGRMAQWLFFGKTSIDPNLAVARFFTKFLPPENRDEKRLNELRTQGNAVLGLLDSHLEVNDYLAGRYSMADIACYPYVNLAPEGGIDLSPYPSVMLWCDRIRSQPGYISMED